MPGKRPVVLQFRTNAKLEGQRDIDPNLIDPVALVLVKDVWKDRDNLGKHLRSGCLSLLAGADSAYLNRQGC